MQIRIVYPYAAVLLACGFFYWYWLRVTPRRLTTGRRRLLLGCRCLVLALLVAGLLRVSLTHLSPRVNVVFLLDMSHSVVAAARQQGLDFLRAVLRQHRQEHRIGVVAFGADAVLERGVSAPRALDEVTSQVDGTATNIARAIQVGMASFPLDGARHLVLLSDGNENVGAAAEAALLARSLGVRLFVLPLGRTIQEPEVRVEKLVAPARVRAGMPYRVEAVVSSTMATPATLALFRDAVLVQQLEVTLQPGKNRYQFPQESGTEGIQRYEVVVTSLQDTIPDNNRWQAFTEVLGKPKILLVYDPPERSTALVEALQQQGIDVQARPWQALPQELSAYLAYEALILDNVPSFGISVAQMEILERYVRDLGGGLVMLGGEKSFGAGGYYRTPLEKMLPVDMDIPTKMSLPSLCLVMVIDRSDSMGGSISGSQPTQRFEERTTKLEVAKIAAFSAMKLLNPFDQVGLLAFNADWEWTVPITEAGKREQIAGKLATLSHAGGTDLYKAVQEGVRALQETRAVKKHLITLSDGLTPNMDFEALMREASDYNITVTTVALGKDADRTLMDAIAHWGHGRSYYTDEALFIPRIFTAETILVSRGLIEEQPFQALLQTEHALLRGIQISQAPILYGYVVTYGKPAAEILLVTPKHDPLLAVQRYGLGKTAAFTADLNARWGKEWLRWPQFAPFVAQLMRWVQRQGAVEHFDVQVEVRDGQAIVQADVYDLHEHFVNALDLTGSRVLTPQRQTLPVTMLPVAPGRYQGRFPVQGNGEYVLSLVGTQGGHILGSKTVGLSLPYSAEYLGLDTNESLLHLLAERTGGQVLRGDDPEAAAGLLLATPDQIHATLKEYWPWCVAIALCFFILDIALRQMLLATQWRGRARGQAMSSVPERVTYTYDELETLVHRRAEEQRRRNMSLRDARHGTGTTGEPARYVTVARVRQRPSQD
ncbi:MAG: VWA domain-containing protein [Candidatus Tectimicrobiota bacterium]